MKIEQLRFLNEEQVRKLVGEHGSPLFVYSKSELNRAADNMLQAIRQLPYGGTVRFAIKANPHPEILKLFNAKSIMIDASSSYEAKAALNSGVAGKNILLTSQQLPPSDDDFKKLKEQGVQFTATSIHQLETYCRLFPKSSVSVRLNPGMGSGMNNRLTTGGVSASFGIWYEYIPEVLKIADRANVTIERLHTHIGTGTDPLEWEAALDVSLHLANELPDVTILNIGGGFKAGYLSGEHDADMVKIMKGLAKKLKEFKQLHNRELHLEIEPGRLIVVHAGSLITQVVDKTDTGENGYQFMRINSGMNDILRPAMYGAQHPLVTVSQDGRKGPTREIVVAGHCCESSDVLTTAKGNPEELEPRLMNVPEIDDYVVVECAGAYCAGMRASGYNSYPLAKEIVVD